MESYCSRRFATLPPSSSLFDAALAATQKIDEHELGEVVGIRKVSFAIRHRGHLFDELDEIIVAREHERINHDAGFAASLDFAERRFHHPGIAAHRVFVESP